MIVKGDMSEIFTCIKGIHKVQAGSIDNLSSENQGHDFILAGWKFKSNVKKL